ncbi:MAG: hypothetical protein AAF899_07305 [Pseudomonadota bacterium]
MVDHNDEAVQPGAPGPSAQPGATRHRGLSASLPTKAPPHPLARALAFAIASLTLLPSYALCLGLQVAGFEITTAAVIGFLPVIILLPPLVLRLEERLRGVVGGALARPSEVGADRP